MLSKVVTRIENKQTVPLEKRSQYEMLGYYHDTEKLIYVENIAVLKNRPKQVEQMYHYLWKDINLTKGRSFPERYFKIDGVDFILKTSPCNGVKVENIAFR